MLLSQEDVFHLLLNKHLPHSFPLIFLPLMCCFIYLDRCEKVNCELTARNSLRSLALKPEKIGLDTFCCLQNERSGLEEDTLILLVHQ